MELAGHTIVLGFGSAEAILNNITCDCASLSKDEAQLSIMQ
jgi:hypothetical protein